MNRIVLAAVAAALLGTGGAGATDTRTLSEFLVVCRSSPRTCHANIEDYLLAARDQGFVCLPQDLSLKDAASEELSWLRNDGAADAALKQGTAEDAQWTAINTLWPCKKE